MNAVRAMLIAIVFCALAWPAAIVFKDHRLLYVMQVLGASIALNGFGNPRAIMLTKDMIFWQQFLLQAAQQITSLVVSVTIAVVEHSYWALLLGSLAGQLVGIIVSYTVLPFRPRFTFRHAKDLMSFSVWLTFSQIVSIFNWRLDQLLIGAFLGKPQLGYYVVGDNLAHIPTRETTAPLTTILFPAFSKFANDPPRLASAYTAAQALTAAVTLPFGVGLALIATPFVEITMGPNWRPAIFIIQALAPIYALQTLANLALPLAMAVGQTPMLFKRDLQAFLFRSPFIVLGIYFYGLSGIIYARIFVGIAGLFFNINIASKITGLTFIQQMRPNIRAFVSVTAMAIVVGEFGNQLPESHHIFINLKKVMILTPLGAIIYGSFMVAQWHIAGRPNGPETEVASLLVKAANHLISVSQRLMKKVKQEL